VRFASRHDEVGAEASRRSQFGQQRQPKMAPTGADSGRCAAGAIRDRWGDWKLEGEFDQGSV